MCSWFLAFHLNYSRDSLEVHVGQADFAQNREAVDFDQNRVAAVKLFQTSQ